mmetsp:Transcript_1742/g.2126  ORF Transcript_1742/g.2126 Transcript_1742/m.2126 type:complete len:222 (-) Transcript_1742:46-711(-)
MASQSESISSMSSNNLNSKGLPRIMISRTNDSSVNVERHSKNIERYKQRLKKRLQNATNADEDIPSHLQVTFTTLEIREFPIILGDNPALSQGPPITIGWQFMRAHKLDLEKYEKHRPTRRTYAQMNIPMELRFDLLQRCGERTKDVMNRIKEVKAYKAKRLETSSRLYRSGSDERFEKLSRGFKNLFSDRKRKEKKYLRKTQHLGQLPTSCDISDEETDY